MYRQLVETGDLLLAYVEFPGASDEETPCLGGYLGKEAAYRRQAELATI